MAMFLVAPCCRHPSKSNQISLSQKTAQDSQKITTVVIIICQALEVRQQSAPLSNSKIKIRNQMEYLRVI